MKRHIHWALAALVLVISTAGCSSHQSFRKAEIAASEGDWDSAVLFYMEAVEKEPENLSYKAALLRTKIQASQYHFEKAKEYREAGVLERSLVELQQAVQLDPTNQYAQVELEKVREEIQARQEARDSNGTIDELKDRTRGVRPQPPELNPRSNEPIDMDFPSTPVKTIYGALAKAFDINILFDPNLKDQPLTIRLKDVAARDALEIVMRSAGHFYKVQDEHTIIVVADTPQNRRNYEDLVIQTFFLSNADVKSVMTMLRSLVEAKKIAVNEQLNAIVLRDTADKVKVAEKIIEANDKAKAEVVVDVELLQVNSSKMRNIGLSLSNYGVTQSLDLGGDDVPLRLSDFDDLTSNNWSFTIPDLLYNFLKTDTDAQLLAKPQLRISEGERARLLIGERVPIPTTSFNTSNTVGGNIVPLTTFQYTDVGIRIEIEPRVHHNKEITLKVTVEVSNISSFVEAAGGQRQPIIGTRTIESTIRLRDGETNFLAGLIRTEDLEGMTGIPGLSDIPLLGRLFTNTNTDNTRTDVILTMTPHIIRTPDLTEEDLLPIWVGTEANITFRGGSPRVESDVDGPFDGEGDAGRVQEMLRERLQRLPRGLRDGENGNTTGVGEPELEEQQQPSGMDLAPTGGPGSFFGGGQSSDEPPTNSSFDSSQPLPWQSPFAPSILEDEGVSTSGSQSPSPLGASFLGATVATHLGTLWGQQGAEPATVRLRLIPQQRRVLRGETVAVAIEVDADSAVAHLPLELRFDPRQLEVQSVEAGSFLGAEGESLILGDTSEAGRLLLGASQLGAGEGASGSGTLATVVFRSLEIGNAEIAFANIDALAPGREAIAASADAAMLSISSDSGDSRPPRGHDQLPQ
ncbi:MAG: secretin N-terminal domain-containing protein [Acidobacteriota bacterium]